MDINLKVNQKFTIAELTVESHGLMLNPKSRSMTLDEEDIIDVQIDLRWYQRCGKFVYLRDVVGKFRPGTDGTWFLLYPHDLHDKDRDAMLKVEMERVLEHLIKAYTKLAANCEICLEAVKTDKLSDGILAGHRSFIVEEK